MRNKKLLTFIMILVSFTSLKAQENNTDSIPSDQTKQVYELRGQIVSAKDNEALPGAHIFNMNSVRGASTDVSGYFAIETQPNDTIFISHIGYQSIKIKITNDLLKGNELEISLYERTEQLQEVQVKSVKLIGVLEIDAKNVPTDKYTRIHINGLPQTYEVGSTTRRSPTSAVDAVFQPIDFLYHKFGKQPKQLKKIKKMKEDDEIRKMLSSQADRELMLEYLEITEEELNELLDYCSYSEYFKRTASDIQVIEAVLECYGNYTAVKEGSTKRDK